MSIEEGNSKKSDAVKGGLSPRCLFYTAFGITVALDLPAVIAFIVIGAISRSVCTLISPIFLIIGGSLGLTVYVMFLIEVLLHRVNESRGFGQLFANVLQMLRIGCYLGASFTMWMFWLYCSRLLYYCCSVAVPIYCFVVAIQIILISKF